MSTDIIVGVPGETEEDFQATLDLVREVGFSSLFGFKYSPRPYTPALKLGDDVAEATKSDRLARLFALADTLTQENLGKLVGSEQLVLVEGPSKVAGRVEGRTEQNEIVHLAGGEELVGEMVAVAIVQANKHSLIGELTAPEKARPRKTGAASGREAARASLGHLTMPLHRHGGISPELDASVFVAPNATVIGDVVIGPESSIWFGAVVRGDVFPIRIGARTNVQDNTVIHVTNGQAKTTIGDDVTIGHLAIIHGCTIGSRCLVGMGSIILDNAVLGNEVFVAAGTLVPPRAQIPPRSLVVGRPGRVIRALTDADLSAIREASSLYVGYAAAYAAERA